MSTTTIYNNRVINNSFPEGFSFFLSGKAYSNQLPTNVNTYDSQRSAFDMQFETKTADYTTSKNDYEKYLRFTSAATVTIHSPAADELGKAIFIGNMTSFGTLTISTSATLNGGTLTTLAAGTKAYLLVVGEGEYDVFTQ